LILGHSWQLMTLDPEHLASRLAAFDGRALTTLGEIDVAFSHVPGYFGALVECANASERHISAGATWLIKSAFEAQREISVDEITAYCRMIPRVTDLAAQLHVCQTIQYLQIDGQNVTALADWLSPLLTHERPFVRAWSLDALSHIAIQHPEFEAQARANLIAAEQDSAASVKARARQVAKRIG